MGWVEYEWNLLNDIVVHVDDVVVVIVDDVCNVVWDIDVIDGVDDVVDIVVDDVVDIVVDVLVGDEETDLFIVSVVKHPIADCVELFGGQAVVDCTDKLVAGV